MKRIASVTLLVAALACGSGDSGDSESPQGAPSQAAPSQASKSSTTSSKVDVADDAEQEATLHPSVPRCLDLVRAGELVEAVSPCTEALKNAPGNDEVAAALEKARTAASEQATAAATDAASGAAAGATGDAASALEERSGSLPTALP